MFGTARCHAPPVGTTEQRRAGTALVVFGGLNALLGLVGLMGGGQALVVGLTAAMGVVFVLLGLLVRDGSRPATVAAVALLGLLLAFYVLMLVQDATVQLVVWVLITGAFAYLAVRALRSL